MEIRNADDHPRQDEDLRVAIRERRLTPEELDRLHHEVEDEVSKPEDELYKKGLKVEKFVRESRPEPDPSEVYRLYYEEGLSQKKVAKAMGYTEWAIRKVFKKYGLETRSIEGVHSDIDHDIVCKRFFEDGWSQRRIAKETGLTEWFVRRILSSPRMEALEDPRLAMLSDTTEMIEFSRAEYEEAIRRNPELRLMRSFDKKHYDVLAYFDLKDLLAKGEVDHVTFARERGIYYGKVARWAQDVKQPTMLVTAYDCELRRLYKETYGSLPEVEPDLVHEDRVEYEQRRIIRDWARKVDLESLLRPEDSEHELLKTRPALTRIPIGDVEGIIEAYSTPIETLAELVEVALGRSSRVSCIDLSEVDSWKLHALRETFLSVPEAVELAAIEKVGDDPFRIGLVDDTLYVWKPDSSFFNLMNIYSDLYFYFNDRSEIARLIAEVGASLPDDGLGLRETVECLEEIISQMLPGTGEVTLINDKGRDYRILGAHLHLLLDIANLSPSQLEGRVAKITNCAMGNGGIDGPRFLSGEELEVALARLAASILCDGHIKRRNNAVGYYESDLDRIRIFKKNLQQFGDVKLPGYWDKDGNLYNVYMSTVFGIILQQLGVVSGDKTVQNPQLNSEFIEGLSWKALCALIEDTLPEDGTVAPNRISCTHSMALHAGDKTTSYGFAPLVGSHEIELIKSEGEREDDLDCWRLQFGKLEKLTLSKDSDIASLAKTLSDVSHANPSNFIIAEHRALEKLEIKTVKAPISVNYYHKSGRVSVAWKWTVTGDDAIKLAIIAPPNDAVKRGVLRKWLRSIPLDVEGILLDLELKGLKPNHWWKRE